MEGTIIGGNRVVRRLGEGGMGVVYLAEHQVLGTPRVIKILLPQWSQHPVIVQRFVNEARAASSIQHRNIIAIHDCGQLPDGQWYIVMDFLDGGTLASFASSHGGPMSPHVALAILCQVANGLEAAHGRGIVHRDLKPENIFLSERHGNPHHVTILDFGIAKLGEHQAGNVTNTGAVAGTPAYMAPEQMRALKTVDLRADVYALGVIAYQLVTGGWLPHQAYDEAPGLYQVSSAELFHRQLTTQPIDPRERFARVPDGWAGVILNAIATDPAHRIESTRAMIVRLAEVTPSEHGEPDGTEIVRNLARELLDADPAAGTVRSPRPPVLGTRDGHRKYELGERIGSGGMAEVIHATAIGAEGFRRKVAIKRVMAGLSANPAFAAMFVQEAQVAASLSHPNIVAVLDFDRDSEGRLFLVMEHVNGKDLDNVLEKGPLPPPIAVFVACEVLRALGHAHELPDSGGKSGLVHRDVSPHNVMVSWEGAVKLTDFGIAKVRLAGEATASVVVKGKPAYMSPEQANAEALDGRSDLFAVGVMLWEMLTGKSLFTGTAQAIIAQVMFREIEPPSRLATIPPELDAVVMRLLERDRNRRFARADEAIDALSRTSAMPRDGRRDLARLLQERFSDAPRTSTPSRPSGGSWVQPTTLGSATGQSTPADGTPPRRRSAMLPIAIGAIVAVGLAIAIVVVATGDRSAAQSAAGSADDQAATVDAATAATATTDAALAVPAAADAVPEPPTPDATIPSLSPPDARKKKDRGKDRDKPRDKVRDKPPAGKPDARPGTFDPNDVGGD